MQRGKTMTRQSTEGDQTPRERNVAHLWSDKRIIRFLRKNFSKQEYKNLRNIYLALCEIDSDFCETKHLPKRQLHSLIKTAATYAGMSSELTNSTMIKLRKLGFIDYGRETDEKGRVKGSYLILFEYLHDPENPYMGNPGTIRNDITYHSSFKVVSKDTTVEGPSDLPKKKIAPPGRSMKAQAKKSVSGKFKTKPKPTELVPQEPHPLIVYWNSLPNVPKLNLPKNKTNYSKTYRMVLKHFKALTEGCFSYGLEIDKAWGDRCRIPEKYWSRKWPEALIKSTLLRLSLLYSVGYWPENKDWLKKMTLPGLLFNPNTGKSWFMYVAASHPKKLHEILDKQTEERHPYEREMVRELTGALNFVRRTSKLRPGEYGELLAVVKEIGVERKTWMKNGRVIVQTHFPTLRSQVEDYSEWLKREREGNEKLIAKWLGPKHFSWKDYIKFTSESIGVDLVKEG